MPDLGISASIMEAWEALGDDARSFLVWTTWFCTLAFYGMVAVYGVRW